MKANLPLRPGALVCSLNRHGQTFILPGQIAIDTNNRIVLRDVSIRASAGGGFGKVEPPKKPNESSRRLPRGERVVTKKVPQLKLTIFSGFGTSDKKALISELLAAPADTRGKKGPAMKLAAVDEMQEDDLVAALWAKAEEGYSNVLVETSDVTEPEEFVTFLASNSLNGPANLYIDSLITCVDAASLLSLLTDPPLVSSVYDEEDWGGEEEGLEAVGEDPTGTCAIPILKQIEYADILVVSGLENAVSTEDLEASLALLRTLNPHARVLLRGPHVAPLRPSDVLGQDLFDPDEICSNAGWIQALAMPYDNGLPNLHGAGGTLTTHYLSSRFTLTTAIYRSQRLFHPQRLHDLVITQAWPGLIRGRGFCLLASRPDDVGTWDSSGQDWQHEHVSRLKPGESTEGSDEHAEGIVSVNGLQLVKETLEVVRTGRWQSIVFMGVNFDYLALKAALDKALLTDEETKLGPEGWAAFPDPLPPYELEEEHDHHSI